MEAQTMHWSKEKKQQTIIYITSRRKQTTEQHEPHWKLWGWEWV